MAFLLVSGRIETLPHASRPRVASPPSSRRSRPCAGSRAISSSSASRRGAPAAGAASRVDAVLCRTCERDVPRIAARACALCQEATAAAPGGLCRACEAAPFPLAACCAEAWFEAGAADWVKRWKYAAPGLRGLDPARRSRGARAPARRAGARAGAAARCDRAGAAPSRADPRARLLAGRSARGAGEPGGRRAARRSAPRARARHAEPDRPRRARAPPQRGRRLHARARARVPETVWLVDDVVTTGATLGEAARVLRAAGAQPRGRRLPRPHPRAAALKGRG